MKNVNMKRFIYFFIFFLLLILSLFFLFNVLGTKMIKKSLIQSSKDQLTYTNNMLHTGLSEVTRYGVQYTADNSVRYYEEQKQWLTTYDAQKKRVGILDRLNDQLLSSQFAQSMGIFWKNDETFISTSPARLKKGLFTNVTQQGWQSYDGNLYYFSVYPYIQQPQDPKKIQYIVGVQLNKEYITGLLKDSFRNSNTKAFILVHNSIVLSDQVVNKDIVREVKENGLEQSEEISELSYQTENNDFFILVKYIQPIDAYIVTYTKTNAFLNPLKLTHLVFSSSIIVITIIGLFLLVMFYRNFYQNISLLARKFHQVEVGDYGARISEKTNNEFNYLFKSFNHMVVQIQTLFTSLKVETKLRRKAEIKQLQAQINPHFLYNSLFFIMSMAKTSPESVIKMSKHLAKYYRYMTNIDSKNVTLTSELELADHYLSIISLCKNIDYKINLPSELGEQRIMPLIIQPIVENAIQHGIEERQGAHRVLINVQVQNTGAMITVADDGKGMTADEIKKLKDKIEKEQSPKGKNGVGLWNIHHRLKNTYGKKSNLQFFTNDWGGVTVSFFIDFSPDGGRKNAIINS